MATIKHKNIGGSDIHEPKGFSTAATDSLYVANGASSGTWGRVPYFFNHQSGMHSYADPDDWTEPVIEAGFSIKEGFILSGFGYQRTGTSPILVQTRFLLNFSVEADGVNEYWATWRLNGVVQEQLAVVSSEDFASTSYGLLGWGFLHATHVFLLSPGDILTIVFKRIGAAAPVKTIDIAFSAFTLPSKL